MRISKKLTISFLLLLIVALAACGRSDETGSTDETDQKDSASNEEVIEVPLGYTGPLSGPAAFFGENTISGLEVAIDEINEAGGFEIDGQQYKFKLVKLDDKYLPNEAANNAKRLVQEDDVKIIFVPHSGGIYAMQVFNENDDFIIGAYTSEPGILEEGNELTWRIPPAYDIYMEPFTDYQMERFGNKIAFLPTNSQYGKDWADLLRSHWEAEGGEIVFESSIDFEKDTDFNTVVRNALEEDPDVLFLGGPSEPTARVAKQARDLGFEGGFLLMDQAELDEMSALFDGDIDWLEGAIGTLPLISYDYSGTDRFVELYNELYDKDPGSEAGLNYVAVYALMETMKLAGTVDDTKAIREALDEGVRLVPDENQVYQFGGVDEHGGTLLPLDYGIIENGEIVAEGDGDKKE